MKFPVSRFLFKTFQQFILSILYFLMLEYISYVFYPLTFNQIINILIVLFVIQMIAIFIEFIKSNPVSRFIVTVLDSLIWFAVMFSFIFILNFIVEGYSFKIPLIFNGILAIFIVGLFIYGYYNAHNPQIVERTLHLDNLDEEINIIHISDIHVGSIRTPSILEKVVSKINTLDYDFVVISGDIADGSNTIQPHDFDEFKKIDAPIFFTSGNHDYYTGIENVFAACENAGITVLDNDKEVIKGLNIYGAGFKSQTLNFKINKDENNLLILHVPLDWDFFADEGFNIILSGHTHGGQFYIAKSLVSMIFPLLRGVYEQSGNYIVVSDGVGTLSPPVRLGTKSEIGLIKLRKRP